MEQRILVNGVKQEVNNSYNRWRLHSCENTANQYMPIAYPDFIDFYHRKGGFSSCPNGKKLRAPKGQK
jgi:hypothetical protein